MGNKFLFLAAGLLVGYWICKKRTTKDLAAAIQKTSDDVTAEIESGVDKMLAYAEEKGLSVGQIRENFKQTA